MKTSKLSIVIPAYNEERYLPRLLKSITRQNCPALHEVVVANAESTDATKMIAQAFGCKVVLAKKGTPAYARNAGALAASGDILLFLDADSFLQKNFLNNTLSEMDRKGFDVAGCYAKAASRNILDKIIMNWIVNWWYDIFKNIWPNIIGAYIFARKDAHERIGGFDEKITFAEDCAYVNKANKIGLKYGLLKSSRALISMRRFEKEGRIRLTLRYAIYTLKRFKGEMTGRVNYNYGEY